MKTDYTFCVRAKSGWGTGIGARPTHCAQCGNALPIPAKDTCSTGYGCGAERPVSVIGHALHKGESCTVSDAVCYACCAVNDRADMLASGKATLYLCGPTDGRSGWVVSNWPGSLTFPCHAPKRSRNNFGAERRDVWFTANGRNWHGVSIGDTQIVRCKALAEVSRKLATIR